MKKYESPSMDLVRLECLDVIVTSTPPVDGDYMNNEWDQIDFDVFN